MQRWVALQTVVQLPQWVESTRVLTHEPPHDSKPAGQLHALVRQISPGSQALPQEPQLRGFDVVLRHTGGSPHAVVLAAQAQIPA